MHEPSPKLAVAPPPWLDRDVRDVQAGSADVIGTILALLSALANISAGWTWTGTVRGCKAAVRWLSLHTGVPALLVAAVLIVVGYRLLKRSARFALEVLVVTLALVLASELGWLRW